MTTQTINIWFIFMTFFLCLSFKEIHELVRWKLLEKTTESVLIMDPETVLKDFCDHKKIFEKKSFLSCQMSILAKHHQSWKNVCDVFPLSRWRLRYYKIHSVCQIKGKGSFFKKENTVFSDFS